ncbi:MAG: NADH-quinone oxidoreductase subunit NuoH [Phycisphaerales bacterium]
MTLSAQTFVSLVVIFTIFGVVQGAVAYCILLERKISAWVQDRIGPNRVGPAGLLQPIADGLKLFFKEDYFPSGVDRVLFLLAPAFGLVPALIGWAIVPWGGVWMCEGFEFGPLTVLPGAAYVGAANISVGIVFVLATAGVAVYGVVLAGWASNSKYAFLGSLRAGAQMISYEIPMGVAILIVLLLAGSLRPDTIVADQVAGMWNVVAHPLMAVILFTSMLAEANRAPFDLAEAEQELVGGFHTEYSSMKWALFFFGEYSHMITSSAIFAILFLGGWHLFPFVPQETAGGLVAVFIKTIVMFGKIAALITLMMVIRWTLPRFRYDQLMNLAWRMLIPVSLIMLVGVAVLVRFGLTEWWWMLGLNVGVTLALLLAQPLLNRGVQINRRERLVGSRFYPPESAATSAP